MDNTISLYITHLGGIPLGKPYENLTLQQRAGFRATFWPQKVQYLSLMLEFSINGG